MKMTITDQIKILDKKILQNEAQCDLDRKGARISALSSNNLDKYEYKGLSEDDKKEGLFKRLKNIEDNNEKLVKVKNKSENMKEVTDFIDQPLRFEAKKLIEEIKVTQKDVDYRKLKVRGGNNVDYNFSGYKTFKELFRDLYYKKVAIDDVEAN